MIKRLKKLLAVGIMVLLIIYAFIQYPEAREPMFYLFGIIILGVGVIALLKIKDKKDLERDSRERDR